MGLYDKQYDSIKTDPAGKDARTPQAGPAPDRAPRRIPLRDDGIYCLAQKRPDGSVDHYMCLRFYPRLQKVIECSFFSLPSPSFFTLADRQFRSAVYVREGDGIRFATVSPLGRIEYRGTVREDGILMSWHSFINGRDFRDEVYAFVSDGEIRQSRD